MATYTVRFEIEINAATPLQAATIARDMMLDPDSKVHVDIFPMEWIEEAEEYHPTHKRGWYAWFDGSVHPKDCFAWEVLKS
jgi:hypothetical protein